MIDEVCVIGHPSSLGGADTELDHQIRCWSEMGVCTHICPTSPINETNDAMKLEERGCVYHEPMDWASIEGLHCIAFCNGEFLANLEEISKYARTTTFVNCMSWNFDQELEGQERGWLDFHLYQTEHSFQRVSQKLKGLGEYRPMFFVPYFDEQEFDMRPYGRAAAQPSL
ncbi:MAG: hypothetical protein MI861_28335, partial [Pirellulales bacterium]|nr:hypothetical protein [Pirellulales bacterium]